MFIDLDTQRINDTIPPSGDSSPRSCAPTAKVRTRKDVVTRSTSSTSSRCFKTEVRIHPLLTKKKKKPPLRAKKYQSHIAAQRIRRYSNVSCQATGKISFIKRMDAALLKAYFRKRPQRVINSEELVINRRSILMAR